MTSRLALASMVVMWAGASLLLAEVRWFVRPSLTDRLRAYTGGPTITRRQRVLSAESFREVAGPIAILVSERIARILGIGDELAVRLQRVHSQLDTTAFRVRETGYMFAAFGAASIISVVLSPPIGITATILAGAPLLAFLAAEQQVARASKAWQRRIFLELPVISEQLAMLFSAGYSLGAALNRVAGRGAGACAEDLARVCGRIRQGLSEVDALREWAAVVDVPALDRLVPVLALNREASDLGRLLSEEARTIRRDVQRELVATMERRGQQVWIPVTVATLVPGVIFLAVPFMEALRLFAGS